MDTPDDYTVVMHMKRVFAPAIDTIFGESDTILRMLPAHLLAKYPNLNQVRIQRRAGGDRAVQFVTLAARRSNHLGSQSGLFSRRA